MNSRWFPTPTGAVDLNSGALRGEGDAASLSTAELRVFQRLAGRAGAVVPTSEVMAAAWEGVAPSGKRALDVLMMRLRRKVGDTGRRAAFLVTVPGVGYRLEPVGAVSTFCDPVSTLFVGRQREIDWLRDALRASRAVVVVGPPGAGKSRVVRRALSGQAGVEVDLSGVTSRADALVRLAGGLGAAARHESEALESLRRLDARAGTVVLDRCPLTGGHVRAAVERALAVTSSLRVVAIAACDLEIVGQRIIWVGPLDAADGKALLLDRARALSPGFASPDGAHDDDVAAVIRGVDGLPGALEAVAHGALIATASEMARDVRERRTPLTGEGGVHHILEQVCQEDWDLLRAICVFPSRFSRQDAAIVGGLSDAECEESLRRLVRWGLVGVEGGSAARRLWVYHAVRGAAPAPEPRHVEAMRDLRLARRDLAIHPDSMRIDRDALERVAAVEGDIDGLLRGALDRGDGSLATRVVWTVEPLIVARGWRLDHYHDRFLDVLRLGLTDLERASVLRSLAWLRRLRGQASAAVSDARRACDLAASEPFLEARCRLTLATILADVGGVEEAGVLAAEARACAQDRGWEALAAVAANTVGIVRDVVGDWNGARQAFHQAVVEAHAIGCAEREAAALVNLGGVLTRLGEFESAERCYRRSECVDPVGAPLRAGAWLLGMGNLELGRREPARAAAYYREVVGLYRRIGQVRSEATAWTNLGWALADDGQHDDALSAFEEALELARGTAVAWLAIRPLHGCALMAWGRGDQRRAQDLIDEASAHADAAGVARLASLTRCFAAVVAGRSRCDEDPNSDPVARAICRAIGGRGDAPEDDPVQARVLRQFLSRHRT